MASKKSNHSSHGGGRHHGSRGHRHTLKHRFKRWLRRHKWIGIIVALSAVMLVVAGIWMRADLRRLASYDVIALRQVDVGGGYRNINYKGKAYRYNNRITSILYAGIDSDDDIQAKGAYVGAPRADSISLVVMDEFNNRMTIIALNRDTMTGIHKYTVDGKDRGAYTDHLGFAFTYGDGGAVSGENLCRAVSDLLFGIPIEGYVVSNRASLPIIGETIGPVEVVVPNNDLEEEGFIAGEAAIIDSSNLSMYVRSRDTAKDFSNVGRMERQQSYINGAIDKVIALLTKDSNNVWRTLEQAEGCVLTDITRNRYLDLTRVLKNTHYYADNYYTPEGEQLAGTRHDEFYPDLDLLHDKVVELFYIES